MLLSQVLTFVAKERSGCNSNAEHHDGDDSHRTDCHKRGNLIELKDKRGVVVKVGLDDGDSRHLDYPFMA